MLVTKKYKKLIIKKNRTFKLYFSFFKNFSFKRNKEIKRIVICFDGKVSHGGLVDRLKGIISFYEISKQLNYDFYIIFNSPFKLEYFLKPNKVTWIINPSKIKLNPFKTKVVYLMDNFDTNPLDIIQNSSCKDFLIYSNIDYLKKIYSHFTDFELNNLWKNNFEELFTPSKLLAKQKDVLNFEPRIVFHTRFTTLLGDFEDSTKVKLGKESQSKLLEKVINKINTVSSDFPGKDVYVLSDSIKFLQYIKLYTTFKVLEGTPKHIEVKGNKSNLNSHMKTFIDFYFIMKSEEVFLLKIDQMYNSGFSKYASILGGKKFSIIE